MERGGMVVDIRPVEQRTRDGEVPGAVGLVDRKKPRTEKADPSR